MRYSTVYCTCAELRLLLDIRWVSIPPPPPSSSILNWLTYSVCLYLSWIAKLIPIQIALFILALLPLLPCTLTTEIKEEHHRYCISLWQANQARKTLPVRPQQYCTVGCMNSSFINCKYFDSESLFTCIVFVSHLRRSGRAAWLGRPLSLLRGLLLLGLVLIRLLVVGDLVAVGHFRSALFFFTSYFVGSTLWRGWLL